MAEGPDNNLIAGRRDSHRSPFAGMGHIRLTERVEHIRHFAGWAGHSRHFAG